MKKFLLILLLALSLVSVWPKDAWAVFQLSVSPRRGGQSLRFTGEESGGLMRNEEVTLAVTADTAVQYRILQTVYQPLTNEFGNTLPASSFVMFSPSNPLGTLRTQLETAVGMGQSQIYTSNSTGSSDEFVLVYNVRIPENQPGGIYRTQLTFSAEPLNMQAGVSPSTLTLEVRVEIDPKFRIDILSEKSSRSLDLGRITKERKVAQEALIFDITSNVGSTFRVFQQLTEPLMSSEGKILEEGALTFTPSGNTQGSFAAGVQTPAPSSQSLLYTSGEWGGSDRFEVRYTFSPALAEKSGSYRGNLSFRVESNSPFVPQTVLNFPVTVEVESIFSLDVSFAQGGSLNFGVFKNNPGNQERQVVLKVNSNLGQPYQIMQIMPRKITNEEGTALKPENFQYFTQNVRLGTASASPRPVVEGESVVYTSDNLGTPEEFVVGYLLSVPPESRAGSYNSEVKYSITTL